MKALTNKKEARLSTLHRISRGSTHCIWRRDFSDRSGNMDASLYCKILKDDFLGTLDYYGLEIDEVIPTRLRPEARD